MASEYIQDLAFRQITVAIMATANTVGSTITGNESNSNESSILGVMRRKWEKVQDVIQGIAAPLKRRSMYDELPEQVWPSEHIEMSHIQQKGIGHNFVPCHLTNPTWCDYCGDFIWGLYKQCLRCQTCQYTCHQHCIPAVTLNCKSVSEDSVQVKTPSPTEPRSQLETSLSLGSIHARPGCARSVTLTCSQDLQQHSAACTSAHGAQGKGLEHDLTNRSGPSSPYLSRSASEGYVTAQSSLTSSNVSRPTTLTSKYNPSPNSLCANVNPQAVHTSSGLAFKDNVLINEQMPQVDSSCKSDNSIINATDNITDQDIATTHLQGPEGEEATEKDETDSGYRSGTIPDDKLPRVPSQDTLDRQELKRKIAKFNHFVPAASFQVDKESFQGFIKVTLNLIRPITMELGARPPSIYELLTREHIVEENTQQVAFYMPRDTHKSLHITSDTTTKEVVATLLKKFHIIDHPRKFAMYEQEFSDRNKLVRLRRLTDKDFPLRAMLTWDPERIKNYRMVLQENETGEIVWDAFSLPELNNFLKVLDREEKETILELKHKYAYMRQYMERRLAELRHDRNKIKTKK